MEFHQIYALLLAGDSIKLQFQSEEEISSFKNSLAVYFHRQNSKLRDCGMADEYKYHSLLFQVKNLLVQIRFAPKERRNYNYTIVQVADEEGTKET